MKLVTVYGAPGVGKLTTGRALAELTGFTLFHNHLTFNLVHAIFPFPSPPFWELSATIKLATFEAAARTGLPGLVFTLVYAAPEDDEFVARMIETVERLGAEPLFVRLSCDTAAHEARITAEGRREMGKIASVDRLRAAMDRWNLTAPIASRPTLEIDNSTLSPEAAARQIAEHFALPMTGCATEGGHRA